MTLFWLVVAVGAIVTEMLTGTLYLLVIGIAAAVATGLAWAGVSWEWQCMAAAVVGVAGALSVRHFKPDGTTRMPDALQGTAEVLAVTAPGKLRVRWRGTEWDATGDAVIQAGDKVSIVSQQGNVLSVALAAQ
jgi:membrane protein implicated in regulation of membrane protease activity